MEFSRQEYWSGLPFPSPWDLPDPGIGPMSPALQADSLPLLLLLLLSHFSRVQRQPNRLLYPWDSPGKNTGVGCHFLLQCVKVKSESEVAQSCPTLIDPMDCSLPGSSIHGIFQARVLGWVAIAFSGFFTTEPPLDIQWWTKQLWSFPQGAHTVTRESSQVHSYLIGIYDDKVSSRIGKEGVAYENIKRCFTLTRGGVKVDTFKEESSKLRPVSERGGGGEGRRAGERWVRHPEETRAELKFSVIDL